MEDVFPIKIGDIPASYVSLPEGSLRRFFFSKAQGFDFDFSKKVAPRRSQSFPLQAEFWKFCGMILWVYPNPTNSE